MIDTKIVHDLWNGFLPTLMDYVKIPNCSPAFSAHYCPDDTWSAAHLLIRWARSQQIPGLSTEVLHVSGRTPLIFAEIPGTGLSGTVLLYGHFDKQPPMLPWREFLHPYTPVYEDDKLYGRGVADDGYAIFASLTAIRVLAQQNIPYARCIVMIEASEESGSPDLPAYFELLAKRIGTPDLVICLDSGCGDYERLWLTTSLRGLVTGDLRVQILTEGVHSGDVSGIVPSSFRILRQLLDRIEDSRTGVILVNGLHAKAVPSIIQQAVDSSAIIGEHLFKRLPWVAGGYPITSALEDLALNRTWRPALSITGVGGIPPLDSAGNVLRPYTTVKLSMRLPPNVNPEHATKKLKEVLESDPPYGAHISFTPEKSSGGWNAPPLAGWLEHSIHNASLEYFGNSMAAIGEGGTIPFMGMLGEQFPQAQFLVTGVLGPQSNAHGPNEFLHIPTGEKLTACVAQVIADHAKVQK